MFEEVADHVVAWWVAGLVTVVCVVSSIALVVAHLNTFTIPRRQRAVIRIVLMVPIYAVASWFSLRFKEYAPHIDLLRDCYEAFVIYSFIGLVLDYGGGEKVLGDNLSTKPVQTHMFPLNYFYPPYTMGRSFLYYVRRYTLQYVVLKPLMAALALVLDSYELYDEGHFHWNRGYVYILFINNISVTVAMYALLYLYQATKHDLHDFGLTPKLLCIKGVLFFSFWQGILCSILVKYEVIHATAKYTAEDVNVGLQDFLICIEMLGAAVAHHYAYSVNEFKGGSSHHDVAVVPDTDHKPTPPAPRPRKRLTMSQKIRQVVGAGELASDMFSAFFAPPPKDNKRE